ncbi:MAG: hypothetical protein H6728_14960 [Myxococcales bacterium]|nr:hypothetical protein [Myxococcales bacterium]MCB9644370.1 hypothetical protein [Myxococcales bacterium]
MKRPLLRVFALLFALSVFTPNLAWSMPRYNAAQLNAMLAKAKADYVAKAVARDGKIRQLRQKLQHSEAMLQRGVCKRVKVIKHHNVCVRSRGSSVAVYVDNKYKPLISKLAGVLKKAIQELTRAYQRFEQDSRVLKRQIDQVSQSIKRKESFNFEKKIKKLKDESTKLAKKYLKTEEWKKKILSKVGAKALLLVPKVVQLLRSQYFKELQKYLKKGQSLAKLRNLAKTYKVGLYSAKAHGKGIVIAIALSVGLNAVSPVIACWKYSGSSKRSCLQREIASSTANMAFDIAAAMVSVSVDILVIEPLSHALAAKASAALAAISAGIGAVGYPIVYGSCSLVLNGTIIVITEGGLRLLYNQTLKPKMAPLLENITRAAIQNIPDSAMQCWGPKALCN